MFKKESHWNHKFVKDNEVGLTLTSSVRPILYSEPRYMSDIELIRLQTFPDDYKFKNNDPNYICGMSVPPFMTQRIALEIGRQWFNKDYQK